MIYNAGHFQTTHASTAGEYVVLFTRAYHLTTAPAGTVSSYAYIDTYQFMQATPVHVAVPGVPSHLVFATATLSPNAAINATFTETESSNCGAVPLSTLAGRSQGLGSSSDPSDFFFVATPQSTQSSQNKSTQASAGKEPLLYHASESGSCKTIHTLSQVRSPAASASLQGHCS